MPPVALLPALEGARCGGSLERPRLPYSGGPCRGQVDTPLLPLDVGVSLQPSAPSF